MKKNKQRAIISTILLICTIIIAVTGLVLYFQQSGRVLGMPRKVIKDIHTWCGFVMVLGIIVHFIINLSIYIKEWKSFKKKDK